MSYLASDLVTGALRLIEAVAPGDTPTTDEAADGFLVLQQLLDAWSADELAVFATQTITITLAGGTASYPSTGFSPTTRPVKILSADLVVSGLTFPVKVIGPEAWALYEDKQASSSLTKVVYFDYGYPTGTALVAPKPAVTALLNLYATVDLATLATQSTAFAMPEAYAEAIRYNLAVRLAPEYARAASAEVLKVAMESKAAIRALNASNRAGRSQLELPPVPAAQGA